VQLQVQGEALELTGTRRKQQGSAREDFDGLKGATGLLTPTDSCFLLFALDGDEAGGPAQWALVSYIPVATPVR